MKRKNLAAKKIMSPAAAWLSLSAVALAGNEFSSGQSVIYSGPLTPVTPVSVREQQQADLTNSPNVFIPSTTAPTSDLPQWLRFGPLHLRPHVDYQYLYGTGIQSSPSINGKTAINTVSPGMLFEYGQHWALDYTPTLMMYSNHKFHDTLGHSVSLNGGTAYEDWQFGLSQTYSISEQVLAETGGQSLQENFGTSLNASRILNDKMSMDFSLAQKLQDTDGFQGSRDWNLSSFLNYQFWERFTLSGGGILGYVNVDTGPDQTYQDLQMRMKWRITDKIGISANAGGEVREFENSDSLISPVYGISINYQPRERTQLSIGASSSVAPSLFAGLVTETTGINAGINQRLFKKFSLAVNANYGTVDYKTPFSVLSRNDKGYGYNVRLSHPFLKHGEIALVYQVSDNQSSKQKFSYHSDQYGLSIGYKF